MMGMALDALLFFVMLALLLLNGRLLRLLSDKDRLIEEQRTHINQLQYSIQRSQSAAEIWERVFEERSKETVYG